MTARIARWSSIAALALAATSARAQAGTQAPAPPTAPPPAPAAPGSQSTAGSQGQSSTAQPSSPGASSQQVVVNPPQPVPPAAPPSSTTVVNPPPAGLPVYAQPYGEVAVVERREKPNPLAIVAMDAAYGGVAGLLVGGGVALVQEGDDWGRDLMVGAGIGLIVGAVVGVAHAVYETNQYDRATRRASAGPRPERLVAGDGLNRTDRDPVITAASVGLSVNF